LVNDSTGEEPHHGMVSEITNEVQSTVTCLDEHRHGLEDGDFVTFAEIKGMDDLNDCSPKEINVLGPYTFTIGDTTGLNAFVGGSGVWTQVKQPKTLKFVSYSKRSLFILILSIFHQVMLKEMLEKPEFFYTDFAKLDRPPLNQLGFRAVHEFEDKNGKSPLPRNEVYPVLVFYAMF
jgi:ubiquitin-activating enzyme E1